MVEKAKFDEKGWILPRKHLVEPIISDSLIQEYYNALVAGIDLYTCVVIRDKINSFYFEDDNEEYAVLRVFWKKDDIKRYVRYIEGIRTAQDESIVDSYTATVDILVMSPKKACSKAKMDKIYKVVASTYINGILEDIDLFWTPNEENRL